MKPHPKLDLSGSDREAWLRAEYIHRVIVDRPWIAEPAGDAYRQYLVAKDAAHERKERAKKMPYYNEYHENTILDEDVWNALQELATAFYAWLKEETP